MGGAFPLGRHGKRVDPHRKWQGIPLGNVKLYAWYELATMLVVNVFCREWLRSSWRSTARCAFLGFGMIRRCVLLPPDQTGDDGRGTPFARRRGEGEAVSAGAEPVVAGLHGQSGSRDLRCPGLAVERGGGRPLCRRVGRPQHPRTLCRHHPRRVRYWTDGIALGWVSRSDASSVRAGSSFIAPPRHVRPKPRSEPPWPYRHR